MTSQLRHEEVSGNQDRESKHQRHVVVGFWILLGCFIALMAALMYAESQGFFQSHGDRAAPSWPASLQ